MKIKLLNLGLIGAFLISLLDIYGNPHFVYQRIHVHSQVILGIAVLMFLVGRFVLRLRLFPLVNKVVILCAVVVTPLASILILINDAIGANFIYSLTRINIGNLLFVGFSAAVVSIANSRLVTLRKHQKLLITLSPLLLAIGFFLLAHLPQDFLKQLTDEDGVVETIQTIILFIGSIVALLSAVTLSAKGRRLYALLFFLLSLGLFFVAGEEIAWGQRILGITTPEALSAVNKQNEITLHNVDGIHDLIGYVYFAIAIIGTVAPLPRKKLKNKFLLPSEQLTFFFALGALYYTSAQWQIFPFLTPWPEIAEVFLYLGASAFMIEVFLTLRNPNENKKSKR